MADNNPLRRKTRSMRTDSPLKEYVPPKRARRTKQTTRITTTTATATAATVTADRAAVPAQSLSPAEGTLPSTEVEENAVVADECEKKRFQPSTTHLSDRPAVPVQHSSKQLTSAVAEEPATASPTRDASPSQTAASDDALPSLPDQLVSAATAATQPVDTGASFSSKPVESATQTDISLPPNESLPHIKLSTLFGAVHEDLGPSPFDRNPRRTGSFFSSHGLSSPPSTPSSPPQSPARSPQLSPSGTSKARYNGQIIELTNDEMQLVLDHRARKAEEAREQTNDGESRALSRESASRARTTTPSTRRRTDHDATRRIRSGRIQRRNRSPTTQIDKEMIRQLPGLDGKTGKSRVKLRLAGLPFDEVDRFFDGPGPSRAEMDMEEPRVEPAFEPERRDDPPERPIRITALMDDGIREKMMEGVEEAAEVEVEGGDKQITPQQEQGSKRQEQQTEDATPSPQTPNTQRWGLGSLTSSISRAFNIAFHRRSTGSPTEPQAPASAAAATRATDVEQTSSSRDRDQDQMIPGRLSLHQPPPRVRRGADERLALAARSKSRQSGRNSDESASDNADDGVPTGSKRKKRTYRMDKPHTFGIPEGVFDASSSDEANLAAGMDQAKGQASPLAEKPNERSIARARRPTAPSSSKKDAPATQRPRAQKRVRLGGTIYELAKHEPSRNAQPTKSSLAKGGTKTSSQADEQTKPTGGYLPKTHQNSGARRTPPKKVIMKRWYSPPTGASFGLSDRVLDESDSDIEVELNEQGLVPDAVPGVASCDIEKMNRQLQGEIVIAVKRRGKPVVPSGGGSIHRPERVRRPEMQENTFEKPASEAPNPYGAPGKGRIDTSLDASANKSHGRSGFADKSPNSGNGNGGDFTRDGGQADRVGSSNPSTEQSKATMTAGGSHWTQLPPPRPTPGHASLPTAAPTTPIDNVALARARSQAEKYKPKLPSGLRRSSSSNNSASADSTNEQAVNDKDSSEAAASFADGAGLTKTPVPAAGPSVPVTLPDGVVVDRSTEAAIESADEDTAEYQQTLAAAPFNKDLLGYDTDMINAAVLAAMEAPSDDAEMADVLGSSVALPTFEAASFSKDLLGYDMDMINAAMLAAMEAPSDDAEMADALGSSVAEPVVLEEGGV